MKRMNSKRKLISYVVIWSVFIGSLLSYSPKTHVLSASGVPEIKILTPDSEAVFDVSTVEFTGIISDDLTTPDKLSVRIFEQLGNVQQPIDITGEGKLSLLAQDQYADFSFSKDFSEGAHTLTFVVTDSDGTSNKVDHSFSVKNTRTEQKLDTSTDVIDEATNLEKSAAEEISPNQPSIEAAAMSQPADDETGKRPYMEKMYLIPKGAEDQYTPGNAVPSSFLPAEDMTRVPLDYKILIDVRSIEPLSNTQPLITFFGDITGTEKLVKETKLSDEINAYVYSFTPNKRLDSGVSYYVYLNPKFSNDLGYEILPRFLKFTTVSGNYERYQFPADKGNDFRDNDYIHGPFSNVTNACAFCHSTHTGTTPTLDGGNYGAEADHLCMACHDGTNGSPKLESNNDNNQHVKDSNVSCTSCHNPHTPGTKENPNSMHRNPAAASSENPFYTYKKASTATGDANDFSLCLSCHNGKVDAKTGKQISNIEQYYKNETFIRQSGHKIAATIDSGSSLNGQLPCAECHETHGSNNIKMLRHELGNAQADNTTFSKTSGDWDASSERQFCLSCHNSKTVLYGKTARVIFDKSTGAAIDPTNPGHMMDSGRRCSECHSDNNSFVEAAHAPKKVSNP
ncbi:cytochrome c3 family protein [Bacillus sp. S3]|uniref:cytochrome c3 family protein n=1 Tax=Bacillus sp. S3 TaxID=486398 RepID=UPI0016815880|nr:cytochrome c3 family protein [Bacillus sp. S3]